MQKPPHRIQAGRQASGRTEAALGLTARQPEHTAGRAVVTWLGDKFVRISDFVFRQRLPSLSGSVQIFDGSLAEPTVHRMEKQALPHTLDVRSGKPVVKFTTYTHSKQASKCCAAMLLSFPVWIYQPDNQQPTNDH